jgi:beta-phosphoglucomutase family hydrolase
VSPVTRAVIFDMDGVLVDNSRFHREAWRRLCAEEGIALGDPEFWRVTIGRPVAEAVPRLFGRPVGADELARLVERRHALYHDLADGRVAMVPGVLDFVRDLRAARVPRALATSAAPASAAAILDTLGLTDAFGVRVTAADVRRGKPDPEVYLTAAGRLGVPPEACLVFEDALVGIAAARRAGMRVVGVATAYPASELAAAGAALTTPDFRSVTWAALSAALDAPRHGRAP